MFNVDRIEMLGTAKVHSDDVFPYSVAYLMPSMKCTSICGIVRRNCDIAERERGRNREANNHKYSNKT